MQHIVHVDEKKNIVQVATTQCTLGMQQKKKTLHNPAEGGGCVVSTSRSPQPCFCFLCCFLLTQRRSSSWRRSIQWRESFCAVLHVAYANARVWCCVCGACVAMKSLTWRKKHLSRCPFSSMSETLYRNCTILLLSICTHLHTYVHTYTHMHWTTVFFFEGEHN